MLRPIGRQVFWGISIVVIGAITALGAPAISSVPRPPPHPVFIAGLLIFGIGVSMLIIAAMSACKDILTSELRRRRHTKTENKDQ